MLFRHFKLILWILTLSYRRFFEVLCQRYCFLWRSEWERHFFIGVLSIRLPAQINSYSSFVFRCYFTWSLVTLFRFKTWYWFLLTYYFCIGILRGNCLCGLLILLRLRVSFTSKKICNHSKKTLALLLNLFYFGLFFDCHITNYWKFHRWLFSGSRFSVRYVLNFSRCLGLIWWIQTLTWEYLSYWYELLLINRL